MADASLKRLFPVVHAELFKNLSKASGGEVVLTVRTFVERVDALRKAGGEENQKALALLEKRGLTVACVDEARALLGKVSVAQTGDTAEEAVNEMPLKADRVAAVEEMWAWYQDWSKTARTVVKNRNYLVMLGLTQHHGGGGDDDGADNGGEDDGAPTAGTSTSL